ncbi:hypothetical protein ACFVVM_16980 [Nocardia sp. NPDC058176]|uniref:TY-Chap domain-containing protein n=1 Tax=Nocardia sp. NPDC058176 TaxID=3346368 RepID=UPI0036D85472
MVSLDAGDADWRNLSTALALTLSGMPTKGYLIVKAAGERFSRFFVGEPELWCEIVHNDNLGADFQMPDQFEDRLRGGGWCPPSKGRSDNWHLLVGWPVRYRTYEMLADQVVEAFRQGLHVATPFELEVESWVEDSDKEFPTSELEDVTSAARQLGNLRSRSSARRLDRRLDS